MILLLIRYSLYILKFHDRDEEKVDTLEQRSSNCIDLTLKEQTLNPYLSLLKQDYLYNILSLKYIYIYVFNFIRM